MKKYIISILAALSSVSCLTSTVSSSISIDHTFQIPLELSVVSGAPSFAKDCYAPNVGNTFHKLSNESSDYSWKISNLKDKINLGSEAASVSLSKLTLTLVSGDDTIIINSPDIMPPQLQSLELSSPDVDNAALQRILTSDTMQICLTAYGTVNINSIVGVQNSISFDLELPFDKNL